MFGSGFTKLIISTGETNDIMKKFKSLEESELLIKGVSKTIKNEAKEQKGLELQRLQLERVWSEQVKIFNAAPSFN